MKRFTIKLVAAAMIMGSSVVGATSAKADSNPFIGTISTFGGNFCPRGWSATDGKLLPIASYTALFSLIGTNYGGDGRTTLALPDLRGRGNMHMGNGPGLTPHRIGHRGGTPTTTQTILTMPTHTHAIVGGLPAHMVASGDVPDAASPNNAYLGTPAAGGVPLFGTASDPLVPMGSGSIAFQPNLGTTTTGGGQSVDNQQPYLAMTTCMALEGVYPSRG